MTSVGALRMRILPVNGFWVLPCHTNWPTQSFFNQKNCPNEVRMRKRTHLVFWGIILKYLPACHLSRSRYLQLRVTKREALSKILSSKIWGIISLYTSLNLRLSQIAVGNYGFISLARFALSKEKFSPQNLIDNFEISPRLSPISQYKNTTFQNLTSHIKRPSRKARS